MRIRTDGEYEYRRESIERAAEFYDCNKTKAIVSACEDIPKLVAAIHRVLDREDLTLQQRREIADELSTQAVSFDVEVNVTATRD